mmetsp:Transcript_18927/g.61733  ORF Transcript_18927/g.61733 Transcript_18927/m.61733 type:complete len:402 (-) Transcript_18927:493-1698(-)
MPIIRSGTGQRDVSVESANELVDGGLSRADHRVLDGCLRVSSLRRHLAVQLLAGGQTGAIDKGKAMQPQGLDWREGRQCVAPKVLLQRRARALLAAAAPRGGDNRADDAPHLLCPKLSRAELDDDPIVALPSSGTAGGAGAMATSAQVSLNGGAAGNGEVERVGVSLPPLVGHEGGVVARAPAGASRGEAAEERLESAVHFELCASLGEGQREQASTLPRPPIEQLSGVHRRRLAAKRQLAEPAALRHAHVGAADARLGEHRLDVLCAAAVEVRGSVYGRPSEPHTRLSARARRPACPRGAGARAERGIRQRVPEHLPPHCTAQAIERPAGRQRRRARKEPQARRQRLAESGGAAGCAAAPGGSEGEDGDTTERVGAALGPHEEGCSHAALDAPSDARSLH